MGFARLKLIAKNRMEAYLANPTMPREAFKQQLDREKVYARNRYYREMIGSLSEDPYQGLLRKQAKTKASKIHKKNLKRSKAFVTGKLFKTGSLPPRSPNTVLFRTGESPLDEEEEDTYIN